MAPFIVRKTFGHDLGLSCAFRQWKAHGSHCRLIHGYALAIELVIGAKVLDPRNWVYDFGEFKRIKQFLMATFDHKVVVAADDPQLDYFLKGQDLGLLDLVIIPGVGCESFASYIFTGVAPIIDTTSASRAALLSVTVSEHGANSVTYQPV